MLEKRADFLQRYDWIRTGLMFEPRGHDMMSGAMLFPPTRPDCDVAVLFIETSGCLPMCGHGTIGTITMALEEGLIEPREPGKVYLDTPAGLVVAEYTENAGYVESVRLTNVPSYLAEAGLTVDLPGLGEISVDVAYGGNFYAIVEEQENFPGLENVGANALLDWSPRLRAALNDKYKVTHAEDERIQGISHIQWTGKPSSPAADRRNAVFYGDKALDRSPCGTGTSARLAHLYTKGELKVGDTMRMNQSSALSLLAVSKKRQMWVGMKGSSQPLKAGPAKPVTTPSSLMSATPIWPVFS